MSANSLHTEHSSLRVCSPRPTQGGIALSSLHVVLSNCAQILSQSICLHFEQTIFNRVSDRVEPRPEGPGSPIWSARPWQLIVKRAMESRTLPKIYHLDYHRNKLEDQTIEVVHKRESPEKVAKL
jgi:hypothetical protein